MLFLLFLFCGCNSLPEQCAVRCADRSKNCAVAARQLFDALNSLGYLNVCLVYGRSGKERHAWVEYQKGGKIFVLDPHAVFGFIEIEKNLWPGFGKYLSVKRHRGAKNGL